MLLLHKVNKNLMNPKITSYVVFVHNHRIGAHAPQFENMDDAENFANAIRAVTDLIVSEPIPVVITEKIKTKLNTGD